MTDLTDLHTRLTAAIAARLDVARAAAAEYGGDWSAYPDDEGDFLGAVGLDWHVGTSQLACMVGPESVAAHIASWDPTSAIRVLEALQEMLQWHQILWRNIDWTEDGDTVYDELPVCKRCVPKNAHFRSRAEVPEWPCDEVRSVARALEGGGVKVTTINAGGREVTIETASDANLTYDAVVADKALDVWQKTGNTGGSMCGPAFGLTTQTTRSPVTSAMRRAPDVPE